MSIGADLSQHEKGLILRRSDLAEYPKNFAEALFMQLGRGLRFSFPCINEQLAHQRTPCNAVVTFASISPNNKPAYRNCGRTHGLGRPP